MIADPRRYLRLNGGFFNIVLLRLGILCWNTGPGRISQMQPSAASLKRLFDECDFFLGHFIVDVPNH